MKNLLKRFVKDERGLETIEYAIIAAILVVGIVTTLMAIGTKVDTVFTSIDSDLGTALGGGQ